MHLKPTRGGRLSTRLAVLFSAFSAVLLLSVGLMLERAVDAHFDELDTYDLATRLSSLAALLQEGPEGAAGATLASRLEAALSAQESLALSIHDDSGDLLYAVRQAHLAAAPKALYQTTDPVQWQDRGHYYLGQRRSVPMVGEGPTTVWVTLALDVSHHYHFLHQMRRHFWWLLLIAALLAAVLAGWVARRGLQPLRHMTLAAERLSVEHLRSPLTVTHAPAEVAEAIAAFNAMLARLDASFQRLHEYSANIAHELRTPISNLMTETQVALSRTRSAQEYRETLHSNLEEFDRLARMISDLLLLAKADDAGLAQRFERIDLAPEIRALIEFYDALAEARQVRLILTGQGRVMGDRRLLQRVVANLLSNAIRHTPIGGTVSLVLTQSSGQVQLAVQNPGEPIAAAHLPYLFDRFHRVGREAEGAGVGLGLAIVRSIVQAHGGTVRAEVLADGMVFRVSLPSA